jgi:endonuclease-3
MRKKEKAAEIKKILDQLYPDPEIPLHHEDPFTLLIAVILSAQCTDERVNRTVPHLFKLAKTPQAMSKLEVATIEEIIRPCGLAPTKAKNISKLSKILMEQYQGIVPATMDDLLCLPGVGRKTAQVLLAQAFDQPAFPVDTHIHRLAKRWKLTEGKTVEQTERDLKKAFEKKDWSKIHLQIIYFGRNYCPARRHEVKDCPICSKLECF